MPKEEKLSFEKVWAMFQETDRKFQETDREIKETSQLLKEVTKNLGGLGNTLGSMSEGLIYSSIEKELYNKFKVDTVAPNIKSKKGDENIQIDALAYSNGKRNEVYILEIKTILNEKAIEQLTNIMEKFPKFFTELSHKKRYGIIAAINTSEEMKEKVYNAGFFLANVENNIFKIDIPKGYKPKAW
jgi:hypothetical protein